MFKDLQSPAPAGTYESASRTPARLARAKPSSMRLQAVREHGRVVDFVWRSASGAAERLLHCDPGGLIGERLRDVATAGPLGHPALIDRYRRVLEHGNAQAFEQVHLVDGRQEVVIHRVVPEDDGVTVTLTNLTADRRAQIARLQVNALQGSLRRLAQ